MTTVLLRHASPLLINSSLILWTNHAIQGFILITLAALAPPPTAIPKVQAISAKMLQQAYSMEPIPIIQVPPVSQLLALNHQSTLKYKIASMGEMLWVLIKNVA